MAYSRPVLAGIALRQSPTASTPAKAGVQQLTLNSDIATTTSLGVVQIGSGIDIDANGVISASNSGDCLLHVTLTSVSYTALPNDCFIGVTVKNTTITLPLGVTGKLYIIKNQSDGNVKLIGTSGQNIDFSIFKSIGGGSSVTVVFDGSRWNSIS